MKTMAVQTATDGLEYYDRADANLLLRPRQALRATFDRSPSRIGSSMIAKPFKRMAQRLGGGGPCGYCQKPLKKIGLKYCSRDCYLRYSVEWRGRST
jgi:hypothetical protein